MRPGYKQTEVGVIPEDWGISELEELEPFITSGSRGWAPFYADAGDLFVRITNMSRDTIYLDLSNTKYVCLPAGESEGVRTKLNLGDLLVSITADIGIVALVDGSVPDPAYINQHIALVRPNPNLADSRFVAYFLASELPQRRFRAITDTGAKAGMNLNTVQRILTALPPLPEQRAIAAALGDVDAAVAGLERLIAKKRDLKQAAMQQLLTGQTRLPGFSGEWEVKRLGDVCKISRGASPRPIDSPIWFDSLSNVGWVRISDLPKSEMYLTETTQKLSSEGISLSRRVPIGGLIMSIAATVGRPAITAIDTCIHDGFVHLSDLTADKVYLFYLLKALEPSWSLHGQTGSQMNLNTGIIGLAEVNLPALFAEQTAIATVLSDMDAEIAALQAQLGKTRLIKQAMMQDLLTGRVRLPYQ